MQTTVKTRYKLLALDLDGTVVNNDLVITPVVKERIAYLVNETDCRVVIATGRMSGSACRYARSLGIKDPVISYQGAMIANPETGEQRYHRPIPLETARTIIERLEARQLAVNLYIDDALYITANNPYIDFYTRLGGTVPTIVENLQFALTGPATKLLVIDDNRIDETLQMLQQTFPHDINPCKSRANFCEIIEASVSKWEGISWLARQWGIEAEAIMTIGDQGNDISMLRGAGFGVAMGNAPREVQAIAKAVTTSIANDGVARAIDQYILG